jgi:release factor glutamine methyltransferase
MKIGQIIEDNKKKINYSDLLHIISFALKKNQAFILANFNLNISSSQLKKINEMIKKRINDYPLAYLKEEAFFYHLKFKINENVLIPRPATEKIIDLIKENDLNGGKQSFIDIACGSGAIIITLADLLKKYPLYSFYGLDISAKALKIACYNCNYYQLKIQFIKSDLLNNFKLPENERKIITANLPYLNEKDLKEKTIKFEPKLALLAKENGFVLYRKLIDYLRDYRNLKAYLEIKPSQLEKVKKEARKDFKLDFQDDLSKKIKIAVLER